jgi:cell wall-associated NlpC family hydrolase
MGIQSPNNLEQARSLLKTNNELNLEVSMQILTAAINSETDIAGGNCGSITTPIGNLGLFDRALAAYNGGTGWRKGISDTNVTGKTSNAEHYRNYISKVNGALPYYTQIIKDPNSVTTVNISGVTDSTNKYSAAIVQSVTNLLNTTYKFGGKDPYTGYIDCSGLVTATYKSALGVSLQGNADMIYNSNQLTSVPATNIPVGSLLFWSGTQGNKPGATHVGIYIGNGKYIHASSASGKVIEADFSSAYARKNFLGAKTLIGAYSHGATGSY